ncbi:MAG: MFS transporter [Oligoflexales bacterium]|nr:MFS transporter [Oligoflexales bacterium]
MASKTNSTALLLLMAMAAFITPFMGSAVNVALPSMTKELSLNAIMLSWMQTSFILATAIFLVPLGRLADIYGRRRFFLLGFMVFTLASLALAFSPNAWFLLVMRVFQGFGGAMAFSTSMPILISVFPPERRGRTLGFTTAATYVGLSLGPLVGGLLTQYLGWRYVFLFNVPIGLMCIFFGKKLIVEEWRPAKGDEFDFKGAVLYGVSLAFLIFGFSNLPHVRGWLLLSGMVVSFSMFTVWEFRIESPLLDLRMFRDNSVFAFSNLAALINYSATYAVGFMLSLYLQYAKGLSPREAGMVLVSQPVFMALLSPYAGRLSDRIDPRYLASVGMGLTAAVLFSFYFLSGGTSLSILISSLAVLGISFALFSSPNTNAVMSSVEKKFYSVASGTLGTMRMTGQMLSMGIATLVFALYLGNDPIDASHRDVLVSCVNITFAICGILCFIGVFASLARGKVR